MTRRKFYLYKRPNGLYYAEFQEPDGLRTLWRSTKSRNRDEAAAIVGRWLAEGVPVVGKSKKPLKEAVEDAAIKRYLKTADYTEAMALEYVKLMRERGIITVSAAASKKGNIDFISFLNGFWDYENSIFLKDQRAHGSNTTKKTCHENTLIIAHDWKPYFKGKRLYEITREMLRDFGLYLYERLSSKSVNNRILVGAQALRWAYSEKMIPEDITDKIGGFRGKSKKRDILTNEEIETLKNEKYWNNHKAYTAFYLAAHTALRSGECRALRREDIREKSIYVKHGYNHIDGLKTTKNEDEEYVYTEQGFTIYWLSL
jgi:hypothetical protein